jgi:hypothetical protein
MNYKTILSGLASYDLPEVKVYISYLKKLETEKDRNKKPKNYWFKNFSDKQAIAIYEKVAIDGLYIDGDTITLNYIGGSVVPNYNYQAYKNKLLNVYPNTKFDVQNVFKGDKFYFKKESGKVLYSHEICNPFDNDKEIIGCYCVIKNDRGEFIETLNKQEIDKMRNVARTQTIWKQWYSEMVLKSVIKRACKRHFKDVVTNIELIDNENYDVSTVDLDSEVKELIEASKTQDELMSIYNEWMQKPVDRENLVALLGERRKELELEESEKEEV